MLFVRINAIVVWEILQISWLKYLTLFRRRFNLIRFTCATCICSKVILQVSIYFRKRKKKKKRNKEVNKSRKTSIRLSEPEITKKEKQNIAILFVFADELK